MQSALGRECPRWIDPVDVDNVARETGSGMLSDELGITREEGQHIIDLYDGREDNDTVWFDLKTYLDQMESAQ